MKLNDYLEGMRLAETAAELEEALLAPYKHLHGYRGRVWSAISRTRIESGLAICNAHPQGWHVPRIHGSEMTVCNEAIKVGRSGNSTGARYARHFAGEIARSILLRHGHGRRAAYQIMSWWQDYPHRCLPVIEQSLQGLIPDPVMNRLVFDHVGAGPVRLTVAANNADKFDKRASRPCRCGGMRFDWGCGFNEDYTTIFWHCNKCPRVYVEYVTPERLQEIRSPIAA